MLPSLYIFTSFFRFLIIKDMGGICKLAEIAQQPNNQEHWENWKFKSVIKDVIKRFISYPIADSGIFPVPQNREGIE